MLPDIDPGFEAWARAQSPYVTADPVWRLNCYRESLYLLSLARRDVDRLRARRPFAAVGEQLLRAVGSVSANVAVSYGRPTNADRMRFLVFAMGSARESMTWYEGARDVLGDATVDARLAALARVRPC